VNGNASKVGGGSWAVFSDERLKNIKGKFRPGLKAVMQLQPVLYQYKQDNPLSLKSTDEYVGFSAQAVQRIIPEAVMKNDKGYLLVNNDPIIWAMLNAIKEQQLQIETQQEQLKQSLALLKTQEEQSSQQRIRFATQQHEIQVLKRQILKSHRIVSRP